MKCNSRPPAAGTIRVCLLILYALPGMVRAAGNDDQPVTPTHLSSVILDLSEDASDFRRVVDELVTPQVDVIRADLAEPISAARGALDRLRADPGDANAVARYEDSISLAMTVLNNHLSTFTASRSQVLEKAETAIQSAEGTLSAFRAELGAAGDQSAVDAPEVIEEHLKTLAREVAPLLKRDEPLPPALQQEVRRLRIQLWVARSRSGITAKRQQAVAELVAGLEERLAQLRTTRDDLELAYDKASGQQIVLAELAEYRRAGILGMRLESEITQATTHLQKSVEAIADLSPVLDDILGLGEESTSPMGTRTSTATAAAPRTSETTAYLRSFLPQNEPALP